METVLLVATALYAVSHVDTFVVLTAFCADERYEAWEVIVGHYLGFFFSVVATLALLATAALFLRGYVFLLGLVPLGLGIRGLLVYRSRGGERPPKPSGPTGAVGVVTAAAVGLSAENIALYAPYFDGLTAVEIGVVVAAFIVYSLLVFLLAYALSRAAHGRVLPRSLQQWIVPVTMTAIGVYVLVAGAVAGGFVALG